MDWQWQCFMAVFHGMNEQEIREKGDTLSAQLQMETTFPPHREKVDFILSQKQFSLEMGALTPRHPKVRTCLCFKGNYFPWYMHTSG